LVEIDFVGSRKPTAYYLKGVETVAKTKHLTKHEKLQLIMDDFKLFAKNFIYIVDNNGEKINFVLNPQQQEFNDLLEKNRYLIISKSRQGGFSTYALGRALWQAIRFENSNILIVSYKQDSSMALFEKLKMMNRDLDKFREKYGTKLFPATKRDNRNELLLKNGSRITCVVAGNKDVGRGSTYSMIHLSEFAFYQNQEKQLLSAEQALAKGSGKLVIETTSNGFNFYQKLFMSAWKGESKYKAFFVPFYASLYKEQFRAEHDEAENWFKANNRGNRLREKDLEPDEKILYEKGANLRFLMWRRWKLLDMTLQEFYQEFPSNPMESFISTGQSVFDQSKVLERLNYVLEPLPSKDVYDELPEVFKPYINRGLYIYKIPKKGIRMFGGVDTASGSGGDYSTITIFDSEGEQVLSFYHNKVPVYLFAEIVDAVGKWCNYAYLAIERNSYGLPLIERLRKDYEYMNLLKQKVFDQKGKKKHQLGWTTTNTTKSIMISDFKEQFERGLISIHCKETLAQMQLFQEVDGKMNNKKGERNHDDLIISAALAVQAMKQNKYYVDIA
jgi:Terminase RNaseH-like domain/Terminase large subunit, T4likevirus-type, N-terminal